MAEASGALRSFFPKGEKLCKKKAFAYLFEHGSSIRVGVLSCFYTLVVPPDLDEAVVQAAFSVPKRKFKRAVDRNLLKRRLRECHRLHKHSLWAQLEAADKRLIMLWIYQAREVQPYHMIEKDVKAVLRKLSQRIRASCDENPVP